MTNNDGKNSPDPEDFSDTSPDPGSDAELAILCLRVSCRGKA